ncbi:SAP30-binding protein, partial [Mucuna pruriens]
MCRGWMLFDSYSSFFEVQPFQNSSSVFPSKTLTNFMASKKKHSEGIALLSMYNDDEMEDAEEEGDAGMHMEQRQEDAAGDARFAAEEGSATCAAVVDSGNEAADEGSAPAPPPQDSRIGRKGALTIVDYGNDEVTMSPEAEDGEIYGCGPVRFREQLHVTNGDLLDRTPLGTVQVLTPSNQGNTSQFSEPLKSDTMSNDAVVRSGEAEPGEAVQNEQKYEDPLDKFLPSHPKAKCSEELQRKINKFLEYKKAGKSFNAEVRNRKDYRNPDFLLHAVSYQDIDQIGSCFSKDVFDPHGYDPSDFYDEIEADMRCESERKEQEKKKAQKVEFISGGGAPRISMPVAGASAVTASGLPLVPPPADSINRDGRQNKKSKWDKNSASTIGAHAAISSAANAGGGYMIKMNIWTMVNG